MTASVTVDLLDPTPPYEQLRRQFTTLIETGQLRPEDRLPSIRQLARDLDLATGTVGRAYQELESAGLIRSRRGGGTRVAVPPLDTDTVQRQRLTAAARTYAAHAAALGVSLPDAQRALDRAWSP